MTSREAERGFPRSTSEVCVMLVAAVQRSAVQLGKTEKTTRSLTSMNIILRWFHTIVEMFNGIYVSQLNKIAELFTCLQTISDAKTA